MTALQHKWPKSVYTCNVNWNKCELKFNPTSNPRINLIQIKPSKRTKLVRLCDLIQTKSEKFVCVNGANDRGSGVGRGRIAPESS